MLPKPDYAFWFATGSQDLYGDECLKTVAAHSQEMVAGLNASGALPFPVVWKPTLIDSVSIEGTLQAASDDPKCAGVILWMHTFSPAKMWIHGLQRCRKPLMHLHTQFNREIPFADIDMDFMNTNQSAHGDREFGHMMTRMGVARKVAVGHWTDPRVQAKIASWMRTAVGVVESAHLRVVRFGDNMRDVAVTEGDKVEAELKFGWSVDAYDVSEMAKAADAVPAADVEALTDKYYEDYDIILEGRDPAEFRRHVAEQARIELGLRAFLDGHDYQAIVTNFQTLGGLRQLPGLAIQRLMADGYGFGAEGDWKTAAMVRLLKAMGAGIKDAKGSSFMEDYTYHLAPGAEAILQAHMLEVCPSIAAGRPAIKVDFLSMGELHLQARRRHGVLARRPRPPLPPHRERGRVPAAGRPDAEAPRRLRAVEAAARPPDRGRGVDLRGRRTPHGLLARPDARADPRLGRRDGNRDGPHRQGHHDPRVPQRAALERGRLPLGRFGRGGNSTATGGSSRARARCRGCGRRARAGCARRAASRSRRPCRP